VDYLEVPTPLQAHLLLVKVVGYKVPKVQCLMDHLDCMGKEQVPYLESHLDYKVEVLVLGVDIVAMVVVLDNPHLERYKGAEAVVFLKDILQIAGCSEVAPVVGNLHKVRCFVAVVVVAEDILH